jgi:8-amino-7-oxononanoate synthase
VAGDATLVEWVLQKARSYTFATAAPALLAEAIRAALRRIAQGDALRDQLHARILQLRRGSRRRPIHRWPAWAGR